MLSGSRFEKEYGVHAFCDYKKAVRDIAFYMKKHKGVFLGEDELKKPWWKRIWEKWKWLLRVLFPFVENLVCFIPFFMLNNRTVGSKYFANLDPFLLYVLLFAIVYGQQPVSYTHLDVYKRQPHDRRGTESSQSPFFRGHQDQRDPDFLCKSGSSRSSGWRNLRFSVPRKN